MKKVVSCVVFILPQILFGQAHGSLNSYFLNLSSLDFDEAKKIAARENNSLLRFEMLQLADILFFEGQASQDRFKVFEENAADDVHHTLYILRELQAGYVSLFYNQVKGNAFRHFHRAYHKAKETNDITLVRPCLLALMKYFNNEIAQNSDAYKPYLAHFESLHQNPIDEIWTVVYKMIFYSKSLDGLDNYYFQSSESLDKYENSVNPDSPVLAYIFYEKALKFAIQNRMSDAENYYRKTIAQARDYPFLRNHRFFSHIKLMRIASWKKDFDEAQRRLKNAATEVNIADTLRSSYYLNLNTAFLFEDMKRYDSAYFLLKTAYAQDFQLDFRRNTLEINRLTVELETQEKENVNLKLQRDRTWLSSALVMAGLLILAGYFAFINQRSKTQIQLQEKEVKAMKLEKQLKDQEMYGLDQMIEGQEKERQRIANDLHDNLGSLLATLKLHVHHLKTKQALPESDRNQLYQKTDDLIEEAYQKVRAIAHTRNVGVNSREGLLPAVRNFAVKVSISNQLVIEVKEHGMDTRLENSLEITIFRIIQELITNIIKHARATEATIHLTRHDKAINVMVEDNGAGFDVSRIKQGQTMGLYSIQKRIEIAGGTVTIDSLPGKGTTVIIDILLS